MSLAVAHVNLQDRRSRSTRRASAALLFALAVGTPAASRAQSVPDIEATLLQLDGEMSRIEQAYEGNVDLSPQATYEERLNQGELFFVLQMWDQAATVLYGAVLPENAGNLGYDEGLYQLAESLYQIGNYAGARTYFSSILSTPEAKHKNFAIQRLVAIAEKLRDFSMLDEHYRAYVQQSGGDVPSEIRYLRGKSLFLARRDREAVDALAGIPKGDPHYLRAQYLAAATKVRALDLEAALADFTELAKVAPVAPEDRVVMELVHLARGRLLYELDRLNEAVDAYQFIQWDSDQLTTMLYEVTWTYVRRGQNALSDESLTEYERKKKANEEYTLALRQLEDLRALEGTETTRAADVTLLMGSLRLQQGSYDNADVVFEEVLAEYGRADAKLGELMADAVKRERIIQDILAMEGGALTVETELPAVAARRAAENPEVANAVRVFREIQQSREEIAAAEKMVVKLEALITSENRAELFPELHEGLTRSLGLNNNVLAARARLADLQHAALGEVPDEQLARLEDLKARRLALATKVASLPTTGEAFSERKSRFDDGFGQLERSLHEVSLLIQQKRAQLTAIDLLYSQSTKATDTAPQALENQKRKIKEFLVIIDSWEEERDRIAQALEEAKASTTLSGGKGASERDLRAAYEEALDDENQLLAELVSGAEIDRIRAADRRAAALHERSVKFLMALNAVVDAHVAGVRELIDAERENLRRYAGDVEGVNTAATDIRDEATRVALDHVRAEVHDIVVRADVGIIDTAFARKQRETEKIGRLQRQKSEELTDLNQAYADLTKDEATD